MVASPPPSVLLVEDEPTLAQVYRAYLKHAPIALRHADSAAAARRAVAAEMPDAVLLDLMLPDGDGLELLREIAAADPSVQVIVSTAHGSIHVAVEAMRAGAYDFLVKPFEAQRLLVTLQNALERRRLARIVEGLSGEGADGRYEGFIGASPAMRAVYRIIESVAPSRAGVFITGESGTGKEVCAEAIHRRSPRRDAPFVVLNCAAIPKDLMESEIFGHVRGAFTGAVAEREGAASRADGGTLFLDEVCELEPALQTKLLRFVQTGSFQRVGDDALRKVDLRLVCATNRDPLKEVEAGRFREDLYYRLHVVPLHLPPLRERGEDVATLARHLLAAYAGEEGKRFQRLSPEVEAALTAHRWPGNVRELQNVVRRIVVLNDGDTVTVEMMPAGWCTQECPTLAAASPGDRSPGEAAAIRPLRLVEKDAIETAIALCAGNVPQAAARLGISASTIYRKRQDWERDATPRSA